MRRGSRVWGLIVVAAGLVASLASFFLVTPAFAARFLSSDGHLTPAGIRLLATYRLALLVCGLGLTSAGILLASLPATFVRRLEAALQGARNRNVALAIVFFVALNGYDSIHHTRRFSPDSMNYVDVARNISRGRGIAQSTLGFNQNRLVADATIPSPLLIQPPLYPILIAGGHALGMSHADAALALSALCYGLIVVVVFFMTRRFFDEITAWIAVSGLLAYSPLTLISTYAWSEAPGLLLTLGSCFLLSFAHSDRGARFAGAAGVVAGLAAITRYSFLCFLPVGFLAPIIRCRGPRRKIEHVTAYAAGAALPLGAVVVNNIRTSGLVLPNLSVTWSHPLGNAGAAMKSLLGQYVGVFPTAESVFVAGSLTVLLFTMHRRRELGATLRSVFLSGSQAALAAGAFAYLALVVGLRSAFYFDAIGPRLIAPAGTLLIPLCAGFLNRAAKPKRLYAVALCLSIVSLRVAGTVVEIIRTPFCPSSCLVSESERLSWIAEHTTDRDIIIGDDTVDVPFHLNRQAAVSFSPFPQTQNLTYDGLIEFWRNHREQFDHFYLVLRNQPPGADAVRVAYGPFIADLISGRGSYRGITPVDSLADGIVFRVDEGGEAEALRSERLSFGDPRGGD